MSNRISTALALLAGFLGGAISHYVFMPEPVHAQAVVQSPATEVRAQKFVLVDEHGTPRGVFGYGSNGLPEIQISSRGTGRASMWRTDVFAVRWFGVSSQKSVLADLMPGQ